MDPNAPPTLQDAPGIPTLQHATAIQFAALAARDLCGPGTLSLCSGLQPLATSLQPLAVPLAVIGLGGACLVLAEVGDARAASRLGATDFTVDTLSEALRILKNELRQRRPVSVAVVGDIPALAEEMLLRGVQPQTLFLRDALRSPWVGFVERGALSIHREAAGTSGVASLRQHRAATATERRERDQRLLAELLPIAVQEPWRTIAQRWLQVAPRLFPRDREREYWVAGDTRDQERKIQA